MLAHSHINAGWMRASLQCRATRWLLAGSLLCHLVLAQWLALSPDEAHYALYARHLDWSYYDHPPLVGWMQWPWLQLGGNDLLMRVVPMLCWALTALGVMHLARLLHAPAVAANRTSASAAAASTAPGFSIAGCALLLLVLSPVPHLLGMALVPDSLLMPLTCAVMVLTWHLSQAAHTSRTGWWALLGLSLGLAGLAKYTAFLLAIGVALSLLRAHGMRLFALRGFWLAVFIAAVLVLPVLAWNASHDWASFKYQIGHAAGGAQWLPRRLAAYVVIQVLVFGLLLVLGLIAAVRGRRQTVTDAGSRSRVEPEFLAAAFGIPPLLLLAWLSGRGSTLPHWSAPAWIALIPVAAGGCLSLWQTHRRWINGIAAFQAAVCVAMAVLLVSAGVGTETAAQARSAPGELRTSAPVNPVADLYGWDAAAQRAAALAAQHGVHTLAVMNWSLASRIAWYARPLPVKVVHSHHDQFDLWFGAMQAGDAVLLVDWSLMTYAPPVGSAAFEQCDLLEQLPIAHGGRQIAHFNYLLCRNWRGPMEPAHGLKPGT